ncbi:urease accessory protein UreD [Paenibacillus sp. y28]|uniref:urease accessory protein UreD n=1 Tax=Paenibacillus sp. y28 TaxID=3129110 RepID=UPI003019AEF2
MLRVTGQVAASFEGRQSYPSQVREASPAALLPNLSDSPQMRTQMRTNRHTAPLKIAKTFPMEDGQLAVYLMDCSPGIMAGDRYELEWRLGQASRVLVTNQSYTKVHPCLSAPASQCQTVELEEDALLELMPEPVMLYTDADFSTEQTVRLSPGSVYIQREIVCPGRSERGELFRYRRYETKLEVFYGDRLIYYSAQHWEPGRQPLAAPGMLGKYTHTGQLLVFSDRVTPELLPMVRGVLAGWPQLLAGVSLTAQHGVTVQVLGHRAWEIERMLDEIWTKLRVEWLNLAVPLIRK